MSMRWLHRLFDLLLYTYPPSFRREYAVEMQQVFRDRCREAQSLGTSRFAFHIFIDAAKSAMREWFSPSESPASAVPAAVAADSVPVFFTFDNARFRPQILLQGGIASVLVFAAVALAVSYARPVVRAKMGGLVFEASHPRVVQPDSFWRRLLSRFDRSSAGSAPASVAKRSPIAPSTRKIASTVNKTWLEWMARERRNASRAIFVGMTSDMNAIPSAPVVPIYLPQRLLKSYAGNYVIDPPFDLKISVTTMRGELTLAVPDRPKITLVAASSTKFLAEDGRWVEFTKDAKGRIRLALVEPGWKIEGHRVIQRQSKKRQP